MRPAPGLLLGRTRGIGASSPLMLFSGLPATAPDEQHQEQCSHQPQGDASSSCPGTAPLSPPLPSLPAPSFVVAWVAARSRSQPVSGGRQLAPPAPTALGRGVRTDPPQVSLSGGSEVRGLQGPPRLRGRTQAPLPSAGGLLQLPCSGPKSCTGGADGRTHCQGGWASRSLQGEGGAALLSPPADLEGGRDPWWFPVNVLKVASAGWRLARDTRRVAVLACGCPEQGTLQRRSRQTQAEGPGAGPCPGGSCPGQPRSWWSGLWPKRRLGLLVHRFPVSPWPRPRLWEPNQGQARPRAGEPHRRPRSRPRPGPPHPTPSSSLGPPTASHPRPGPELIITPRPGRSPVPSRWPGPGPSRSCCPARHPLHPAACLSSPSTTGRPLSLFSLPSFLPLCFLLL